MEKREFSEEDFDEINILFKKFLDQWNHGQFDSFSFVQLRNGTPLNRRDKLNDYLDILIKYDLLDFDERDKRYYLKKAGKEIEYDYDNKRINYFKEYYESFNSSYDDNQNVEDNEKKIIPSLEAYAENGNNYQAGANIIINNSGAGDRSSNNSKSKFLDNWQKIVGTIAGISIILTFFITMPEKLGWLGDKKTDMTKDSLLISGIVRDSITGMPIPNAWLTSDLLNGDTITTASSGTFEFSVNGKPGESIRIYVGAMGYLPRNEFHILPKAISIKLRSQ